MDIETALELIKKGLKSNYIESRHVKDQYSDRKVNPEIIRNIIQNNNILGILEQNDGLYKIWFYYEKHKDLNMIIRILPNNKLKLVTLFPCRAERRKRR